ncbi:YqaJ viral recombinase family protein [Marinobacter lutaoensis]|uniref:YqaJ viral recombinase family protein n=1 Tax=Marinobacter lutaoensis TaxID=135739 RepID=UPI00158A8FD6|nr:YqaJ viral recombinase family protein [Marinobacter lutaoensis]
MSAFEKQIKEVMAAVDALPQRAVIPDDVAVRWAKEIIRFEPERAVWHARRAGVIGGSEAGEFVLAALGERPAYKDLEGIWRQKMLLDLPDYPNIYMKRGTALEPLARAVYLQMTGHRSILDAPDVQAAFSKPHKEYAHIGGNPDEVAVANGLRVITDFKVRNRLDENQGLSVINGAQLHWYGLIHLANTGTAVDGYCLAELDLPPEMMDDLMKNPPKDWTALAKDIARINRPGFGMRTRYFKHNQGLGNNLINLTKHFWETYVLTGTPYRKPKPKLPDTFTNEDRKVVENAHNEFLTHKLAETVAKENAERARKTLISVAEKYALTDWPFSVSGVSSGISRRFNTEQAAKDLLMKGVDPQTITKTRGRADVERMIQTLESHGLLTDAHFQTDWDTRAVQAALKEHGLRMEDYKTQNVRIGLSQKSADQPVIATLSKKMANHIESFDPLATDTTNLQAEPDIENIDEPEAASHLKLA